MNGYGTEVQERVQGPMLRCNTEMHGLDITYLYLASEPNPNGWLSCEYLKHLDKFKKGYIMDCGLSLPPVLP